jgi:hypothetical protein
MLFRLASLFEESNYPVMLVILGAGWKPLFVCVVVSVDESKVTSAASSVLIPAAIIQNKLLHCYFCCILRIHKNTLDFKLSPRFVYSKLSFG